MTLKINKLIRFVVIFFSGLILVSCFKQEAPKIESSGHLSARFNIQSCEDVSILKDALKATNVINLFKCLGWDHELPHLYQVINKSNKREWDFLTAPIEDYFLDNRPRRDRLLEQLFILNSKGALSAVSSIVNSAIDSNATGVLKNLFLCAEDYDKSSCSKVKVGKENIINVIKKINFEKSTYKQFEKLIANFIEDFNKDSQVLSLFYNDLVANPNKDLIILLLDTFADQSQNGQLSEEDSNFIFQVLNSVTETEKDPWIYNWLKNINDKDYTKNFFNLLFIEKREQFNDIQNLNLSKGDELSCGKIDSNGREIRIDIKQTLNSILNSLRSVSYNHFIKRMVFQVNLVNTSQEFCPLLKKWPKKVIKIKNGKIGHEKHDLNFLKYLRDHIEILEQKDNWELFRFLANIAYNISLEGQRINPESQFNAEALFMLKALSRPHVLVGIELVKNSILNNADFYPHLSSIIKKTQSSQYKILGHLGKKFINEQRESKDLSILWKNISELDKKNLFKILDTVFANNNHILPILDFIKFFLSEIKISGDEIFIPLFKNPETEDLLYQSIKNLTYQLQDENVLIDLKKLFSESYLLKIIKVFSGGIKLKNIEQSLEKTNISLFESNKNQSQLILKLDDESQGESVQNIACLKQVLDPGIGLYNLIKNPSDECKKVDQFSTVLVNNLADASSNYHKLFFKDLYSESNSHLFDREGLFSPDLIAMSVFNSKAIDVVLKTGEIDGGIVTMLKEFPTFLFEREFYKKCQKCVGALSFFSNLLLTFKDLSKYNYQNFSKNFEIFRNQVIRTFSSDYQNLDEAARIFKYGFTLLGQYSDFLLRYKESPPVKINQKFNCMNWMTKNIGYSPCPGKEIIKKSVSNIINFTLDDFNNDGRNALYYILGALHVDYGVKIPYQSNNARPYHLALIETIQLAFDMSNKNHIGRLDKKNYYINRWPIYYRNVNEDKNDPNIYKTMTTLERIEVTIRDIQFDSNYLGAHYENTVSKALDYNYVVKKNKFLLKVCTRLRFCSHFINQNEKRLVKNALSSYDGLLHANSLFGYGKYMQSVLSVFVASSLKKAQDDSIIQIRFGTRSVEIPKVPSLSNLNYHNGKILYEVAKLGGLNHLARFIHSRIGENKEDITNFILLDKTKRISNYLLKGYELNHLKGSIEKILQKVVQRRSGENSISDDIVEYFYDLNEFDQREIEGVAFNLAYLNTFIGPPSLVGTSLFTNNVYYTVNSVQDTFEGNNFSEILKNTHFLIEKYPLLKKTFTPYRLMRLVKFIKRPVEFLANNMSKIHSDQFYITYYFLNKTIQLINNLLFQNYNGLRGIDLVLEAANSEKIVSSGFKTIYELFNFYDRVDKFYTKDEIANIYSKISNRLSRILNWEAISAKKWMGYFHQSTFEDSCDKVDIFKCKKNYHYDGPYKMLLFLSQPSQDNFSTRLESTTYQFLDRYSQEFQDYIDEILGLVKIKHESAN